MLTLALYVPKPEALTTSLVGLLVAFLALCVVARILKLRLAIAAPVMLVGALLALVPDITARWGKDLGDYGDMAREMSATNYNDTSFAITSYFAVGRGNLASLGGMVLALVVCKCVAEMTRRLITKSKDTDTSTYTAGS
ncbi:MAG: hypothetical protein KDA69_13085 [Planctomycetaceae bacterium]|nr:hypothetical protein [Planctomycetaceae bacterium]MCA9045254.1 hypothetical protein [Planctomycetaceae bacterium]